MALEDEPVIVMPFLAIENLKFDCVLNINIEHNPDWPLHMRPKDRVLIAFLQHKSEKKYLVDQFSVTSKAKSFTPSNLEDDVYPQLYACLPP